MKVEEWKRMKRESDRRKNKRENYGETETGSEDGVDSDLGFQFPS